MNTKRILIVFASFAAVFAFILLQRPSPKTIAEAAPVLDCTNWQTIHPDWFYCQDFEHGDGGLGTFEVARSNGVRCNNAGQNSSCAYSNIIQNNYGIPPYPDVTSYPAKKQTFFVKYSVKVPEYFFTGPGSHGYYLHGSGGAAVIDPWPGYGAMNNIEWDEYTRILLRGSGYQRTSTSFEGFVPKQRGQWHTYQAMIVPSNSDPSVGRIKVWIDGELANDTKTDTLPSYTDFTVSNYWHSNEYITKDTLNNLFESYTAPLHPAFEILFDNLVLSSTFIEDATNTFTIERVKYNTFSAGSFKVNFDTTLPATGKVEWGQTTSYGSQAQESSAAYMHSLTLTNLQPSTQYYLRLSATDSNSRTTEYRTTFTTTAGNVVPQLQFSSWQGEVFQNKDFSGNPVYIKNFNDLDYVSWAGQDSDDLIRTDQSMAVRYTKTLTFTAGDYTVRAAAWDGIRVFVDGQTKVDAPGATGGYMKRRDFNITLSAGNHTFVVEHIIDRKPCPDWECKQGKQVNFAVIPLDTTAPKLISQAIYNLPEASSPTRPYFSGKCNEDCKATIDYGLTTSYGSQLNATYGDGQGTAMTVLPAAQFPSLTLGQTYHYRVTLADNAGNQRVYTDQTFVVGDTIPPQQTTTLRLTRTNSTTLRLTFTAPGNSGRYGQASSYDVRYSTSPLTIYTWPSATVVSSLPAPHTGGTAEAINVPSLPSGPTYYFGITATDAAGNTSLLSNIASNPQGAEVIDMDGDGYGVGSTLGSDCNDYDSSKHTVNTTDTGGYCVGSVTSSAPTSTNDVPANDVPTSTYGVPSNAVPRVGAPTITLKGSVVITFAPGSKLMDPGYTATDLVDGNLTANVKRTGVVTMTKVGRYTLTYTVTDSDGIQGQATRIVVITPTLAPVKFLNRTFTLQVGKKQVKIQPFSSYGGAVIARKAVVNTRTDPFYLFLTTGPTKQPGLVVYNSQGKLVKRVSLANIATSGLNVQLAVNPATTSIFIGLAPKVTGLSVTTYSLNAKGLTSLGTVKTATGKGTLVFRYLKAYLQEFALVTMTKGSTKFAPKVWRYSPSLRKFQQDKKYPSALLMWTKTDIKMK